MRRDGTLLPDFLTARAHQNVCILLALLVVSCGGGASSLTEAQRRIAMLPCPPGVSVELWETLTAEFSGQLERRASSEPLVAGPPVDELSIVDDLTATEPINGIIRLRWRYKNTGDYDQNSETNNADLTPVGRNFAKTSSSSDWNTASLADGDLNYEVNISDITPIGRCYLQTVTEYRVEYNPSGAPGSEFALFGTAQFAVGEPDVNGWLRFDKTFPGAQSGYYRVVPYYNAERGIEGNPVYFGANQPPDAVLKADPQAGRTPMVVNFDASDSSDPEHSALTFSWDWEGDSVFDHDSGGNALVEHEYTAEGNYAPRVMVRDAKGAEATAELLITSHNWLIYEIEPLASVTSAALIGGKPAFAYVQRDMEIEPNFPSILCYARSSVAVPESTADWERMIVHPSEKEGEVWISTGQASPFLFELDNRPAISYWIGEPHHAFYFAHAAVQEPTGPADWVISKVCDDDPGWHGGRNAAVEIDSLPYLVLPVSALPQLRLARGLNAEPQSPADWEISTIGPWGVEDSLATQTSAAFIGGRLCIAFNDQHGNDLAFAFSSSLNPSGSEDWHVMMLDTEGFCGVNPVLKAIEGHPAIVSTAYYGPGVRAIRLARAIQVAPTSAADWVLSSPLTGEYFEFVDCVVTESECAIFSASKRVNGYQQLIALYPQIPGYDALDKMWNFEQMNPELLTDHSRYPHVLFADDWLICIYVDGSYLPAEEHSAKCAIANMPIRYSP